MKTLALIISMAAGLAFGQGSGTNEVGVVTFGELCASNYVNYVTNGLSACGWIATNTMAWSYDVDQIARNLERSGQTTNLIQKLAKSGRICAVVGHHWRDGRPGESLGFSFSDYHPLNVEYRTCSICGTCQSQSTDAWK